MKKHLLLFGLLMACSPAVQTTKAPPPKVAENAHPKEKKSDPLPEKVTLDAPLSQVQTLCLTEGPTSLASAKAFLKKHLPADCKDDSTINMLYMNASGVGERDAVRVVSANQLQCFAEVNNLPPEGVETMDKVAHKIMQTNELQTLRRTLNSKSCVPVDVQQNIIRGGFSCGFLLSLASDSTAQKALEIYTEAADAVGMLDEKDKEKSAGVLMQGSMCYKMVLDGLRKKISPDDSEDSEEDVNPTHTIDI